MGVDRLRVQAVRPGVCYGAVEDVLLLHYRDSPTLEDLRARAGLVDDLMSAHPGGIAFLSVIDVRLSDVALPSPDARAETQRQVTAARSHLVAGATVVLGSAVTKALTSMILSRLPGLVKGSAELRFFSEVAPAASFCLGRLGVPRSQRTARVRELVAGIETLREH